MVIRSKKYGFIDERGTYGFDFSNEEESKYFLVTCIAVENDKLQEVAVRAELIIQKFLKNDELSSDQTLEAIKRKIALKELLNLDLAVFSFMVHKEKIREEYGIKDKDSFLKLLNGILYTDLINTFPQINLINDSLEDREFLRKFNEYLIDTHLPNLLEENDAVFVQENNESLSYLSSMISDIINAEYNEKCDSKEVKECYEIIKGKMLPAVLWPRKPEDYLNNLKMYLRESYDENIAYKSIKIAFDFIIHKGGTNNEAKHAQVVALKYLLSVLLNYGENRYIRSKEVINHLKKSRGKSYNNHYFQTRIIAPLRDCGVLIATSNKGYKIPIKESEILSFINQSNSVIRPMVERVKICRESVLQATNNTVDVLDNEEYQYLKSIIDTNNITINR